MAYAAFLYLYTGLFSTEDMRNPVQNYSWVWMPYCTGDVHVGQFEKRVAGYQQNSLRLTTI